MKVRTTIICFFSILLFFSFPHRDFSSLFLGEQVFAKEKTGAKKITHPKKVFKQEDPKPQKKIFKKECPQKGCFEFGLISEWGVMRGDIDISALRFSPYFGYFLLNFLELAFSPSILYASVENIDLTAFALPLSVIFNLKVDQDLYLSLGPYIGFALGKAEGVSVNGFIFGFLSGMKYHLYKSTFLNVGLGFFYAGLSYGVDFIYFTPNIGFSVVF